LPPLKDSDHLGPRPAGSTDPPLAVGGRRR